MKDQAEATRLAVTVTNPLPGGGTSSAAILNPIPGPSLYTTPFSGSFYHAFGDSITYGASLPFAATQNYAYLVAQTHSLALSNFAIPGRGACDIAPQEIFLNPDAPTLNNGTLYSLLVSTNDANIAGTGPYEAVFNLCHQAAIAWLAVPEQYKVRATSFAVSFTGVTHIETFNNWNARLTDGAGSSVIFPFTLAADGPVYLWYRIGNGNLGQFTVSLDGSAAASLTTATTPPIATYAGSSNSMALLRLPSVTAGSHTLAFTQTSSDASGAGVVAIGMPPPSAVPGFPRVLVGTTPRQLTGGNSTCGQNDYFCQLYIVDIAANVALFSNDHLDVRLWDSRKYATGTVDDMADAVHPNATGQLELAHAIEDSLN